MENFLFDFKEIISTTYTIALPIFLGYIIWLLKRNREKLDDEEKKQKTQEKNATKGTMLVLRYIMKQYYADYQIQQYVTSEQLKDFNEIFECYKALGGNSVAVRWHEEVNKLKILEEI